MAMTASKIHPTQQGPRLVSVDNDIPNATSIGPSLSVIPHKSLQTASGNHHPSVYQQVYNCVFGPIIRSYKRLPWLTKKTLNVSVSLYAVLYIFFTVPLRVAFYYGPYPNNDRMQTHRWTEELTIFTVLDAVADTIGLIEFVGFCCVWKEVFAQLSVFSSLRSTKDRTGDNDRASTARLMIRRQSSTGVQLGVINWTIASINPFSLMPSDETEDITAQQKYMTARNVEFVLELVALVPIELFVYASGEFNALHLVRITKLCRLYRLRRCIKRITKLYSDRGWVQHLSSTGVASLVFSIGLCAGLCHWVACGYMLIAHAQCGISLKYCDENVETSWVVRDRLFGASVSRKYGRTLYWATRTLVLLGYDDVTPVSNAETLYAVVVTLMGALFGSSLLANYLFLFRFRNARYAAYSTHVDNAREYMRLQNIPQPIRDQVMAYFNYAWNTHHSLDSEESLRIMPKHLQAKVVAALRATRIAQVCFLMRESVEFINELAVALVRRVYSPGDQVIEPKTNAQMFFVISGQVVLSAFNGLDPHEYQTGDFLAESCLLFPEQYAQMAIAKTFCELYVLTKAKFDEVLSEFYPECENEARLRMTEMLNRYSMQLRKTKKILGLHDGFEHLGGRNSIGRGSVGRSSLARSKSSVGRASLARSKSSVGRTALGRPVLARIPAGKSARDIISASAAKIRQEKSWRLQGSLFRVLWDTIRLVAIIYAAFEVTYFAVFISGTPEGRRMFAVNPEMNLRYVVTLMGEVFFGVDLILRSRYFAFMDPNVMLSVVRPDLIFSAYKANGFFFDLVAWVPIGVVLDSLSYDSVQVYSSTFRLLRLLRVRLVPRLLQGLSDVYGLSSKFHLVVALVLGVTLMLHVVGCVWFEMAIQNSQFDHNYSDTMAELTRSGCLRQATQFQNCSWVTFDCYAHIGTAFPHDNPDSTYVASFAYLRSVYWAIVTLTAVGYGDIVAYSTAETYFAALWIFVGGIINFGVMGVMSSTISNMMATNRHHIEKINTLNSIMGRVHVSAKLSVEIRRFYHQQFVGHKQEYESELLAHLPDQLCYEISAMLHSKAVKSVALFDSASIEFLREVTGKFRHKTYQNGETVCIEGAICREFLVLSCGSKINVFFRLRKVPIRALQGNGCYGVNEFLLKRAHDATLIAASLVHASVMSREQFDTIERKFASDLRDMKEEAQTLLTEEKTLMKNIVANLSKLKLQPHLMQTYSLFHQRENAMVADGEEEASNSTFTMSDTFAIGWNAVIACWSVYNAVFVIFRICFHSFLPFGNSIGIAVWIADLSCDVCFAVDIYLHLYYFGCAEVTIENLLNRTEVDKRYLRSSTFKWDLFASLPIYVPFASGSLVVGLCRLPRLVRCVDIWVYLDDIIVQIQQHFASRHVSAYLSPVKLMIILVLVAHYVGCIFFLISEHECVHTEHCWMEHDHLLHEHHSVSMLYAKTFYWAITTLLLVGSREIVPRDAAGTIWTGFTCLCCTFIIGHIVGEISELILELGKEAKQYKSRIASFESFATKHDLSAVLRERVSFFFRVEFERTKGTDLFSTVRDLSANLRLKLMLEIYGYSIENLPISRFLTASQINNLALRLQPELFIPGDNILVEGTFGSRLCTLQEGLAAAYWTKSVASVAVLMEGAFFGEIAFFLPNQRRLATVRATTSCEVLSVSKQDWHELWVPSDDASDCNVQKHAQCAILNWVKARLQRYQRASLHTASRAQSIIASRRPSTKNTDREKTVRKASRLFSKAIRGTAPAPATLEWAPTPRKLSKAEICRMFVSPTVQLLERKAEYLLAKTNAFAQPLSEMRTVRQQDSRNKERLEGQAKLLKAVWRCFGKRNATNQRLNSNTKVSDIRQRQYIMDLNPINEHLSSTLGTDNIRSLETESWERFKLLAALQHVVGKLLREVLPSEDGADATPQIPQIPRMKSLVRRINTPKALRPFRFDDRAQRKWSAAIMQMTSSVSRRKTIGPNIAMDAPEQTSPQFSVKVTLVRRRSFPAILPQLQGLQWLADIPPNSQQQQKRMTRSHSLPLFDDIFFRDTRHYKNYYAMASDDHKGESGIDFEILQRCQRPQYATQLHWYHRYCHWKERWQGVVIPAIQRLSAAIISCRVFNQRKGQVSPLTRATRHPGKSEPAHSEVADMKRVIIPNQQALRDTITDLQSNAFIMRVKQVGKVWDLAMLLVSVYHLVVTPFKVCYSHELSEIRDPVLHVWAGLDYFLDMLCLVDVIYKIHATSPTHAKSISMKSLSAKSLWYKLLSCSKLRVDILAMLPLELLLLVSEIRLPVLYLPSSINVANASWWSTRWLLRINRMLLISRIQPISEELFQYVVQDLKWPVSGAFLCFLRALASYLAMGHLLACIWFITSEFGLWHYGVSWLSTSGMLTFIPASITADDLKESVRFLKEVSSGFSLENVSLARKYLRSLMFSMECISTLFYGDILSMNPLELVVEIAITFWSIYIYGALVGSQGERLDATSRQEADFEQSLSEVQQFLLQNDVPLGLRRQVKAYYARMWRRHQGKSEFASVENVSRALYEDVVLATQRDFVNQVRVFGVLDENFLRGLLVCLEYVVCSEGEEVVTKGDMDRSMYFIAQGRIMVRLESGESIRERGEFFGEFALLYGISRLETCMALSVVELYRLDHEPYERLLHNFPGYRRRNKQAWTAPAPQHRLALRATNFAPEATSSFTGVAPILARRVSVDPVIVQHIESELPHTYVYKATMEMLAQLHAMHPEETKDLILKCREGSRKRVSRELAAGLGCNSSISLYSPPK